MGDEINKFLTEAMGECWHEISNSPHLGGVSPCAHCKKVVMFKFNSRIAVNNNFSTWRGFGKLWEWAIEQHWWYEFTTEYVTNIYEEIEPSRFANTIYRFLKKEMI